MEHKMKCRPGCGACCIAPSINEPMPGMPQGKPAGMACVNLDDKTFQCRIWETSDYPDFCRGYTPCSQFCGENRYQALERIALLEIETRYNSPH